jgi:hypothetical protein
MHDAARRIQSLDVNSEIDHQLEVMQMGAGAC